MASNTFFHSTMYKFSRHGAQEVIQNFRSSLDDGIHVKCNYVKDDDIFRIECDDDFPLELLTVFSTICKEYTDKRKKSVPRTFWPIVEIGPEMVDIDSDDSFSDDSDDYLVDVSSPPAGQQIAPRVWKPARPDTNISKTFPEHVLDDVSLSSGCPLTADLENACIMGHAASSAVAFRKLCNIERNAHQTRIMAHRVCTEGSGGMQIQMPRLVDIPKRALLRTLCPPDDSWMVHNLPNLRRPLAIVDGTNDSTTDQSHRQRETPNGVLSTWTSLSFVSPSNTYARVEIIPQRSVQSLTAEHYASLSNNTMPAKHHDTTLNPPKDPSPRSVEPMPHHAGSTVSLIDLEDDTGPAPAWPPFHNPGIQRASVPIDDVPIPENKPKTTPSPKFKMQQHGPDRTEQWVNDLPPSETLPVLTTTGTPSMKPLSEDVLPTVASSVDGKSPRKSSAIDELAQGFNRTCVSIPSRDHPAAKSARTSASCLLPDFSEAIDDPVTLTKRPATIASVGGSTTVPTRYEETAFKIHDWERVPVRLQPRLGPLIDDTVPDTPAHTDIKPPLGFAAHEAQTELARPADSTEPAEAIQDLLSFDDAMSGEKIDPAGAASMPALSHRTLITKDDQSTRNARLPDPAPPAALTSSAAPAAGSGSNRTSLSESDEEEAIIERCQPIAEADTRIYHRTMAQRKGKSKERGQTGSSKTIDKVQLELPEPPPPPRNANLVAPRSDNRSSRPAVPQQIVAQHTLLQNASNNNEGLIVELGLAPDQILCQILEQAKSHRGVITIEVKLGQSVFHEFSTPTTRNVSKSVWSDQQLARDVELYEKRKPKDIFFLERITTDAHEARHMIVPHLFEEQPCGMEALYEFIFLSPDDQDVHVKIGGPDSAPELSVSQPSEVLGQAMLHFPKRVWDARMLVTKSRSYDKLDAIREFGKTLQIELVEVEEGDSMLKVPRIKFRLNSDELALKAVLAKRCFTHQARTHERLSITVTECQELIVRKKTSDPKSFLARADRPSIMAEHHLLWYEAHIAVEPHPDLAQNEALGAGDDATWQVQDVLDDKLRAALMTTVEHLVTRMDSVGCTNLGPRGSADDVAAIRRLEKDWEDEKRGLNQPYW